jgi:hypothetical protein
MGNTILFIFSEVVGFDVGYISLVHRFFVRAMGAELKISEILGGRKLSVFGVFGRPLCGRPITKRGHSTFRWIERKKLL